MFLSLLIIVIISIAVGCYFKKEAVECLPFTVLGIIFILYILGLVHLLIVGLYLIYLAAILSIVYTIYSVIVKKVKINEIITIGLFMFIGLSILLYILLRGTKLICYDEFTAWGLHLKAMLESNNMYIYTEFPIHAKIYQSGVAFLQFFVEKTNIKFTEDILIWTMDLIYLSVASIILIKAKYKDIIRVIIESILIFLIPLSIYVWPMTYYTILVDFILGMVFAYGLYYYYTSNFDKFMFINLGLVIFFLSCSKGTGLILSIFMIIMIYFDLFVFNREKLKINKENTKNQTRNRLLRIFSKIKYKRFLVILLPVISCIFASVSWNVCINIAKLQGYTTGEMKSILGNIFDIDFWRNCLEYLSVIQGIVSEYKYFIFAIICLIYVIINFNKRDIITNKNLKRIIATSFLYFLGTIAFILFLFIVCDTFVTMFLAKEGLRRYLYTVVIANIMLVCFFILHNSKGEKIIGTSLIIILILWHTTPANRQYQSFINKQYTQEAIEFRKERDIITDIVSRVDVDKDIIYFVGNAEIDVKVAYFNVFPLAVANFPEWEENAMTYEEYCEYLKTQPYTPIYKISTNIEEKAVEHKKSGKTYLYIYVPTEEFQQKYQRFFENEIKNNTFYYIDTDNDAVKFIEYK